MSRRHAQAAQGLLAEACAQESPVPGSLKKSRTPVQAMLYSSRIQIAQEIFFMHVSSISE